ncbi:MAG: hypothetical protein GWO04_03775, partial [Actinobacteria bacterium]|nr:hypothetical protein [Actinomycetota bacterium]
GAETSADVSDLVVDGGEGRGVVVGNGAAFTARRASITNTRTSALYASKPGTSIALEDARIESASADDEGRFGRCVNAQ